jgi:hypothetical protein
MNVATSDDTGDSRGPCPACGYPIALPAAKCKWCGKILDPLADPGGGAGKRVAAPSAVEDQVARRKATLRGDIHSLSIADLTEEQDLIERERARRWKQALLFFSVGFGAPMISPMILDLFRYGDEFLKTAVLLVAIGISFAGFLAGFAAVARYKGRNAAFGLLVLLGPFGLLLLAVLEDRYRDRLSVIDALLDRKAGGTR